MQNSTDIFTTAQTILDRIKPTDEFEYESIANWRVILGITGGVLLLSILACACSEYWKYYEKRKDVQRIANENLDQRREAEYQIVELGGLQLL